MRSVIRKNVDLIVDRRLSTVFSARQASEHVVQASAHLKNTNGKTKQNGYCSEFCQGHDIIFSAAGDAMHS